MDINAFPERPNPHSHILIRWELKNSTGTAEECLMVLLKGTTEVGSQEWGSSAAGSLPNRDRSQICLTQTTTIKATMGTMGTNSRRFHHVQWLFQPLMSTRVWKMCKVTNLILSAYPSRYLTTENPELKYFDLIESPDNALLILVGFNLLNLPGWISTVICLIIIKAHNW